MNGEEPSLPKIDHPTIGDAFSKFWEDAGGISSMSPIHAGKISQMLQELPFDSVKFDTYIQNEIAPEVPDNLNRAKRYAVMTALFTVLDMIPERRKLLLERLAAVTDQKQYELKVAKPFLLPEGELSDSKNNTELWNRFATALPQYASLMPVLQKYMESTRGASFDNRGNNESDYLAFRGTLDGGLRTMHGLITQMMSGVEKSREQFAQYFHVTIDSPEYTQQLVECVMRSLRRLYPIAGLKSDLFRKLLAPGSHQLFEVEIKNKDGSISNQLVISTPVLEDSLKDLKQGADPHDVALDLNFTDLDKMSDMYRRAVGCPAMLAPFFLQIAKVMIERDALK